MILKYWWALFLVISLIQTLLNILIVKMKDDELGVMDFLLLYGASIIPYLSLICFKHGFNTLFVILTIINIVYILCCAFCIGVSLHSCQAVILVVFIGALISAGTMQTIPVEASWQKILLGVDIFGIAAGSIGAVCLCSIARELMTSTFK